MLLLTLRALLEEIDGLKSRGNFQDDGSLLISDRAHLIFPYHKRLDAAREKLKGDAKIGTTHRGIGPAYEDKVSRSGIPCGDLLREEVFKEKLKANIEEKNRYLKAVFNEKGFDYQETLERYMACGERLGKYITDTSIFLNSAIKEERNILFEGAQGTLLDVDHGTYPYVTSSNAGAGGVCSGAGVGPTVIDKVIGVSKSYATRVGGGPFPTEAKDKAGERLQEIGGEFGATTGRPRRCGWFDSVAARHSVRVNGISGITLTKLDVLDRLDKIPVCVAYEYKGERIESFPADLKILNESTPVYEELEGWEESTREIEDFDKLPIKTRKYIAKIEELTGTEIVMVSLGARRSEAIMLQNPFE